MKLILALSFAVSLLVLSVGASADTVLVGSWAYATQACESGAKPNPAREEPNGTMTISATQMTFSGVSNSCNFVVGPVAITIASGKVTPATPQTTTVVTCPDGSSFTLTDTEVPAFSYNFIGPNLLTIVTPAETSAGGTCPVGEAHLLAFSRKK